MKILEVKSSKVDLTSTKVQTEIIRCEECEFPAESINDLVFHMYESHPLEEEMEKNKNKCNFCSEKFPDSCELMRHKKLTHIEKVQLCTQFTSVILRCAIADNFCHHRHIFRSSTAIADMMFLPKIKLL